MSPEAHIKVQIRKGQLRKVELTTGPEMVWMVICMHEGFRFRKAFGISAFWDAVWRVLRYRSVFSIRTNARTDAWTAAYPNRHNTLHFLESKKSSPWLLQVYAEGITNIFPQFPVINSIWVELYRFR